MPTVYNYVTGTSLENVSSSVQVYLAKLTIGNQEGIAPEYATPEIIQQSLTHKLFNVIPDIINAMLFFAFYLYWDRKSRKLTEEIKQQIKLPNYSTVEILDFPK